jgi:hypothetical protein
VTVACGRYEAAFALDDPDPLVDAALSCPLCLGADSRVDVDLVGDEVTGRCSCVCGATWSLMLEPQQLLRLALDPPRETPVRFTRRPPPPLLASDADDDDAHDHGGAHGR